MITKTCEAGMQALIYLVLKKPDGPMSPRVMAEDLDLSPSYLAKITGQLVRANVLVAHRGVKGGVTLARDPEEILMLDIVQALQGVIVGDYCRTSLTKKEVCGFHHAVLEIHEATLDILTRWTLADLAKRVGPRDEEAADHVCVMRNVVKTHR